LTRFDSRLPSGAVVTLAHHDASDHDQEPAKLEQLAKIEEAELKVGS
jgi:hypothetical protein